MVKVHITYLDHTTDDDGELLVRIAGRGEAGGRHVRYVEGVRPYLFVPSTEDIPAETPAIDWEHGYEGYDDTPLTKLFLDHPQDTDEVKSDFSAAYESDIPFYRRASLDGLSGVIDVPNEAPRVHIDDIDTDVEADIDPRICIGDIEVLPGDEGFEAMRRKAEQPVVCYTLWDSYDDEYQVAVLEEYMPVVVEDVKEHLADHWPDDSPYAKPKVNLKRCETEDDVLNTFIDFIREKRPDLISGWNWVDFDHQYLLRRMDKLDTVNPHKLADVGHVGLQDWQLEKTTERTIGGLPAFDMMDAYTDPKLNRKVWKSKALDYVAQEELGVGKVEGIDIEEGYQSDLSKLLAYNIIDTQLCVALDQQSELFEFYFELAELSSIPIYDTFSELRLVDGYILSRRDGTEILPETPDHDIPRSGGGLVLSPQYGIFDNIAVVDLKSLYPSTIITCNISPEVMTFDPHEADIAVPLMPGTEEDAGGEITEDDIVRNVGDGAIGFSLEKEGIIPKYVRRLFPERDKYKTLRDQHDPGDYQHGVYDRKQAAIKVIMNSFFGVLNNKHFRLSKEGLGDAITGGSRYVLWRSTKITEDDLGYDVLYADTDSEFIDLDYKGGRDVDECVLDAKGLTKQLNNKMAVVADDVGVPDEHPYITDTDLHGDGQRHAWTWEFEKFYRRWLQAGKKKRYAGRIVWKEGNTVDKTDIMGFESRRSDTPEVAAEAQTEVIEDVLHGADFDEVSATLQDYIEELRSDFDPLRHGLPKSYNPPYDISTSPTIRAAEYSNEHLGYDWTSGSNPWVVPIADTPAGLPKTDYLAIDWTDDVPEDFDIDHPAAIEKCFEQPLDVIIDVAGWDFAELKTGTQTEAIGSGETTTENPFATTEDDEQDAESETENAGGIHDW